MNNNKNKKAAISYLKKVSSSKIRKVSDKTRKVSDCKSKRLEPNIMEMINKDVAISKICKKLNLTSATVKKVARANGVDIDGRIKSGKLKQKTKRNERIYKMLLAGKKYQYIADKMNVTKQRIYEIATFNNFSRWEESRKKYEAISEKAKNDIEKGVPYEKIITKYNFNNKTRSKLRYWGFPNICSELRKRRNDNIVTRYKSGKKAIEILTSKDKIINDPTNVKTESQVYAICSKEGVYKYPKVGRRIDGGSSEDVSILRLIKKLREVNKLSFDEIANHMNMKKYKTVCGKTFNMANARFKYFDAIKEGL